MRGYQIIAEGNWAHFKKPETNNNPLSHDLITKTALIGLMGAILGIERKAMKDKFPILSEDLLYGVQLMRPVKKLSWGFTSRTAISPTAAGSPKYFEFLKNPKFKIAIVLQNERSEEDFENFREAVRKEESIYTPVLGLHNCPANVSLESEGDFKEKERGIFKTQSFVSADEHVPKGFEGAFRIGFERLPTYQDTDFWNLPDKYRNVIYPDYPHILIVEGTYFEYHGENISNESFLEQWFLM